MKIQKTGYHGLYFPELRLALDGYHPDADYLFVSHAHSDHMPRNRSAIAHATEPTLELMERRGFKGGKNILKFGSWLESGRFKARLFPAGHILGSAMIYIESEKGSLLYTGDYRTPPSPATEGFEAPGNADILITEATCGLPIYKWKSHEELADQIQTNNKTRRHYQKLRDAEKDVEARKRLTDLIRNEITPKIQAANRELSEVHQTWWAIKRDYSTVPGAT